MVIVDSGFWLALANKRDTFHQQAIARFPEFQLEGFITTWCVIYRNLLSLAAKGRYRCPHCFTQESLGWCYPGIRFDTYTLHTNTESDESISESAHGSR